MVVMWRLSVCICSGPMDLHHPMREIDWVSASSPQWKLLNDGNGDMQNPRKSKQNNEMIFNKNGKIWHTYDCVECEVYFVPCCYCWCVQFWMPSFFGYLTGELCESTIDGREKKKRHLAVMVFIHDFGRGRAVLFECVLKSTYGVNTRQMVMHRDIDVALTRQIHCLSGGEYSNRRRWRIGCLLSESVAKHSIHMATGSWFLVLFSFLFVFINGYTVIWMVCRDIGRGLSMSIATVHQWIPNHLCSTPTRTTRANASWLVPFLCAKQIIFNCIYSFRLQYVSLLRPPITDSSAPGADIIDKVEWKQVSSFVLSAAISPNNNSLCCCAFFFSSEILLMLLNVQNNGDFKMMADRKYV